MKASTISSMDIDWHHGRPFSDREVNRQKIRGEIAVTAKCRIGEDSKIIPSLSRKVAKNHAVYQSKGGGWQLSPAGFFLAILIVDCGRK